MSASSPRMPPRRCSWSVPEVIQSSSMDCGPAVLKSFLGGFGISLSYGRLREACRTDVDGTCVTTLDEIAGLFGRPVDQRCFPTRDIGGPCTEIFPCITMIRLPNGFSHFNVLWRKLGPWVQVMDPARGRFWARWADFRRQLHELAEPVAATDWLDFQADQESRRTWLWRAASIGMRSDELDGLRGAALATGQWQPVAALDAALRMVAILIEGGGLRRGTGSATLVSELASASITPDGEVSMSAIPESFWAVKAGDPNNPDPALEPGEPGLTLHGAIYLRLPSLEDDRALAQARDPRARTHSSDGPETIEMQPTLAPALAAALIDDARWPLSRLWAGVLREGRAHVGLVVGALVVAAVLRVVETLMLRGLVDLQSPLGLGEQRLAATGVILTLLTAALFVVLGINRGVWRMARLIEAKLRLAFWRKVPRLNDQYFQSRLRSDMAERAHSLHGLRELPALTSGIIHDVATISVTLVAVAVIDRGVALGLAATTLGMGVLAWWFSQRLTERTMRFHSLCGSLSSYFLDALAGWVTLRSHGAQAPLARAQEAARVEWERAGQALLRMTVAQTACLRTLGFAAVAVILWPKLTDHGHAGAMLLLAYWALELPQQAMQVATDMLAFPQVRTRALRATEPLDALESPGVDDDGGDDPDISRQRLGLNEQGRIRGLRVTMRDVGVIAGGHAILDGVDLELEPGEHVAIVGTSGAGKSSLVGVLLGWYPNMTGELRVNGRHVDARVLNAMRRHMAWVDPSIQLWNRSLLTNLGYGQPPGTTRGVSQVIADAHLDAVLHRLEDGLQGAIGEGGALLSGGEAQRVRLARALLRDDVHIVVLDEAFRGLDRGLRRAMLAACRRRWAGATLISVSHDIADTLEFDRVLVVDAGRVVEQGSPLELQARADSMFARMLAHENELLNDLWTDPRWRQLELRGGQLSTPGQPTMEGA